jgi:transcriptional regulator with XRE-family HTH domain
MARSLHTDAYAKLLLSLVTARKLCGITQVELAKRLKKPQQFVSKIETGERRLDVLEFIAIARALNIPPDKLLTRMLNKLPKSFDI